MNSSRSDASASISPIDGTAANPCAGTEADMRVGPLSRAILRRVADRVVEGSLTLRFPGGETYSVAGSRPSRLAAEIGVRRGRMLWRLVFGGSVGLAESYIDDDWETPDLAALIELAARNEPSTAGALRGRAPLRRWHRLIHLLRRNTRSGSQRNIAAHYDLGNDFYRSWLDPSMTYSAALFDNAGDSLAEAQARKYRRIAGALGLAPGMRVLEIGCGWGGFARLAAGEYGCRVTGLTLSREQLRYATAAAAKAGLEDRVAFEHCDYRDARGVYDRVVSIEMIEAVGAENWPVFWGALRDRLRPGGSAMLQIITIDDARFDVYRRGADFIQRYIFPGGMLPAPSALGREIDRAGLRLADRFRFGSSYALTLRRWQDAFDENWPQIAHLGFDERFRRTWKYYLGYCEGAFRAGATDVGQYLVERR